MDEKSNKSIPVVVIQSKLHTVTITSRGKRYKLFQVIFGSNGDLYVNFPYYKNSNGLVGIASVEQGSSKTLLGPNCAKVTSHLVKFAHHPDGEAHFSQKKKVKTEIRKKVTPLTELNGHIFSIMLQGIEGFETAIGSKYDNNYSVKKSVINFDLSTNDLEGIKFVATWQPFKTLTDSLKDKIQGDSVGPKFIYKDKIGQTSAGFWLSPEPGNPFNGYILSLRISAIPKLSQQDSTMLTFMGGFNQNTKNKNSPEEYSFLTFIYPHRYDRNKEGSVSFDSIDFNGYPSQN